MMRSAAYTLSPSSILCIPSLEGGTECQNPSKNTAIQIVVIRSLHPSCCAPQSDTHFPVTIHSPSTVTVQSCRANGSPGARQRRPLPTSSQNKLKKGEAAPAPRVPRTRAAEPRQSAPRTRRHPLDICKQVLFSSVFWNFRRYFDVPNKTTSSCLYFNINKAM